MKIKKEEVYSFFLKLYSNFQNVIYCNGKRIHPNIFFINQFLFFYENKI